MRLVPGRCFFFMSMSIDSVGKYIDMKTNKPYYHDDNMIIYFYLKSSYFRYGQHLKYTIVTCISHRVTSLLLTQYFFCYIRVTKNNINQRKYKIFFHQRRDYIFFKQLNNKLHLHILKKQCMHMPQTDKIKILTSIKTYINVALRSSFF